MNTHLTLRDYCPEERPRERLRRYGAEALSTAELLAIIIRSGTVRANAVQIATQLLSQFKAVSHLARASLTELTQCHGVGEATGIEIQAALELGRRLSITEPRIGEMICSPEQGANAVMQQMALLEQEELRVILLNTRNRLLHIHTVYIGSLNNTMVRVGELFKVAIRHNAAAVIIVHNHPSGDPSPSPEDVRITRKFVEAGRLLNIEVLDHIIIGHFRFLSMKERGLGFD